MNMTIYGIPSCDSVRKTRRWLAQRCVDYTFRDLRDSPPSAAQLANWYQTFGDALVNKRSTTYRQHKAAVNHALAQGETTIIALLSEHPTLIKRPVIEIDGDAVLLGWQEAALTAQLGIR